MFDFDGAWRSYFGRINRMDAYLGMATRSSTLYKTLGRDFQKSTTSLAFKFVSFLLTQSNRNGSALLTRTDSTRKLSGIDASTMSSISAHKEMQEHHERRLFLKAGKRRASIF